MALKELQTPYHESHDLHRHIFNHFITNDSNSNKREYAITMSFARVQPSSMMKIWLNLLNLKWITSRIEFFNSCKKFPPNCVSSRLLFIWQIFLRKSELDSIRSHITRMIINDDTRDNDESKKVLYIDTGMNCLTTTSSQLFICSDKLFDETNCAKVINQGSKTSSV